MSECCEDYKKGVENINDCMAFCANQYTGPVGQYKFFMFCPWCGSKLKPTEPDVEAGPKETIMVNHPPWCGKCNKFHTKNERCNVY